MSVGRIITFSLLLVLMLAGAVWAATVGFDTFTNADTTVLTDHTPDTGAGWVVSGADFTIVNNELQHAGTTRDWARKTDDIGDDDMDVTATLRSTNSGSRWVAIKARMPNDLLNTGYTVRLLWVVVTTSYHLQLFAVTNGTHVPIGTDYNTGITTSDSGYLPVKLEIRSGTQKVYVDTGAGFVERISATEPDTTFQGNTYAGIEMNGNSVGFVDVDNFLSESVTAAAPRRIITISQRFGFPDPKEWLHALYRMLRPAA